MADRFRADGGIGLAEYNEQMVALHLNTLLHIPICQAWCKRTQWSDDGSLDEMDEFEDAGFEASMKWMTWLDQALSLLPMLKTEAWRVAKGFRYDDLTTKFERGKTITWYEPKSLTLSEDVARQWAGQKDEVSTFFKILDFQGHDISFVSSSPGEREAMTRAVSRFEVMDVQVANLDSDDPLMRCDRVTLKQMRIQRRDPIDCCELSTTDGDLKGWDCQ